MKFKVGDTVIIKGFDLRARVTGMSDTFIYVKHHTFMLPKPFVPDELEAFEPNALLKEIL